MMIPRFVFCLLLGFGPVALSFAGELDDRRAITERASSLFDQGKYDELEKVAVEYRTAGRTSSGLWKLTFFYGGLDGDSDEKSKAYWDALEGKALEWAKRYPKSPTPYNVYAGLLISRAWMHRGFGWADQVKEKDWKLFHEQHSKAEAYLLKHQHIAKTDPRWYELMLNVARAKNWERDRFDSLVTEATERHPEFYPIYFAAFQYLLPTWHGDINKIEDFANFAVEKTKKTEGVGMYARVYWSAYQPPYANRFFKSTRMDWDKMKKGMDDVLARYPDQWNINNFAHFACLRGDKQKTKELVDKIKGGPIPEAWDNDVKRYDICKSWTP